ncbi:MAG: epimerase [Cytophagales bacterium]|nr:epimerase [Cytophagales bacterium]
MQSIRAIITGATGMVGKGVLLECLQNPAVTNVLVLNRRPLGMQHPKLKEVVHANFYDLAAVEADLRGYNACYFCLGTSAFRMKEEDYRRVTYDLTLHVANTLLRLNPGMTFCYVSGQGTDGTGQGRIMWARVKGQTENALLALPFGGAYMFRPGFIQPLDGIKSSTPLYNTIYKVVNPLFPLLKAAFPSGVTTTRVVGKAMIAAVRNGSPKRVLETADINRLAEEGLG